MKKIAILDYDMSVIGGVEKVSIQLANVLSNKYEVYLISLLQSSKSISYNINPNVHFVNIIPNEDYNEQLRVRQIILATKKKMRKFLKKEKVDILFSMGTNCGLIAGINCLGLKTKVVFCDHGALINQWNDKKITLFRFIACILSKKIVALTDKTLNDYIKKFKIRRKKITRIYNAIDDDIFKYAKEDYNIESNKIISVGRLGYEKGFDMLVEVAKELKNLNKNWQWDIYGDRTCI